MKCAKILLYAYAVEVCLLLCMSIVALVELGTMQAANDARMLSIMILCSLAISVIVIPVESVVLSASIKRNHIRLYALNDFDTLLVRGLYACAVAFLILWFIHSDLHEHIAEDMLGYAHGSDEYMAWGRPGDLIILPGGFSACMIHVTLKKLL